MKAMVSLSGGVDSSTCLAIAVEKHGAKNASAVSFVYGQRLDCELQSASRIAKHFNVKHHVLNVGEVFRCSNCALLKTSTQSVQHLSYEEQMKGKEQDAISSYVPFRNGVFLSVAASIALSLYPNENVEVYIGAQANDSIDNTYADCSTYFTNAMNNAIRLGTYGRVHLVAPIVGMSKAQVIAKGLELHVPYELTWTCYEGGEKPCGRCAACIDRLAAFAANGIKDPVKYAE